MCQIDFPTGMCGLRPAFGRDCEAADEMVRLTVAASPKLGHFRDGAPLISPRELVADIGLGFPASLFSGKRGYLW
ncbi:MAG: hypothetical protein IPF96_07585 [Rhodobacter sp.]|nr:hypothetical protein [Rhodobacter sp.]